MNEGQLSKKNSLKQKIAFAFLMGFVTTGLVSFTVVSVNIGLTEDFGRIWLQSWSVAYLVIIPIILIVSPLIQRFVRFLFHERIAFKQDKKE
jgi:Kef-type K+ transport system membrane component KefB